MARVYGRVTSELGVKSWVEVTTDSNGFDDEVNVVWLAQVLQLNLGESPFYSDWGLPAHQSVISQIAPDLNVMLTQLRFAPYFASIIITKLRGVAPPSGFPRAAPPPTYVASIISHTGAKFPNVTIPTSIPT